MKKIKFPHMRNELVGNLEELSNAELQQQKWGPNVKGINRGHFDFIIHNIFDDSDIAEDAYSTIGEILLNNQEAELLSSVSRKLDQLLNKYGNDLGDLEYAEKPEWGDIVKSAQLALAELQSNDTKYNLGVKTQL